MVNHHYRYFWKFLRIVFSDVLPGGNDSWWPRGRFSRWLALMLASHSRTGWNLNQTSPQGCFSQCCNHRARCCLSKSLWCAAFSQVYKIPWILLSFRYLRRYGRVCHISMPVLTLARFNRDQFVIQFEFEFQISVNKWTGIWMNQQFQKVHPRAQPYGVPSQRRNQWIRGDAFCLLFSQKFCCGKSTNFMHRLQWQPSFWPWKWRTLRYVKEAAKTPSIVNWWRQHFKMVRENNTTISSQGWVATLKYYSGVDFAKVS